MSIKWFVLYEYYFSLEKKIFLFDYNRRRRGREKEKRERVRERESKRTEEASTAYSVVLEIENEQYNKNRTTPKYNPIDTSVYFFFVLS